jgi:hypothetical protein
MDGLFHGFRILDFPLIMENPSINGWNPMNMDDWPGGRPTLGNLHGTEMYRTSKFSGPSRKPACGPSHWRWLTAIEFFTKSCTTHSNFK